MATFSVFDLKGNQLRTYATLVEAIESVDRLQYPHQARHHFEDAGWVYLFRPAGQADGGLIVMATTKPNRE
jgi:hypothetical protein